MLLVKKLYQKDLIGFGIGFSSFAEKAGTLLRLTYLILKNFTLFQKSLNWQKIMMNKNVAREIFCKKSLIDFIPNCSTFVTKKGILLVLT